MDMGRNNDTRFELLVRKGDDTFVLYSREWHLLVQGTNLSQLYETMKEERQAIIERYTKAGLEHELPGVPAKPSKFSFGRSFGRDVMATVTKIIAVGAVVGLFFFLGIIASLNQLQVLQQKFEKMTSPSPHLVGKIATGAIDKIARSLEELTPERKEKIRQSLRTIIREVEPFRNELGISVSRTSHTDNAH